MRRPNIRLSVTQEVKDKAKELANKQNRSISNMFETMVLELAKKEKKEEKGSDV